MKIANSSFPAVSAMRLLSCIGLFAILGGCAGHDDPFEREGTWRIEHVNDANIAAMASDKRDLVQGVDDPNSPAVLSAQAVRRLLTDHVKPLPSTEIGPASTQSAPAPGGS
jgi:hypothetical protein